MQAHDTFVSASDPLRNYYESPLLALRKWDDPAGAQYAFVKFARPFPLGAKITRAVLAFETSAMGSGSHTLNLARISDPLLYQRVNYNNRPGILASSQQSQTKKGALPAGQRWEFDVLADMQAVSAGAEWWGWRITTTDEERRWIYAQESPYSSVEPPTLLVEWADNPARPLNLSPNDGAVGTGKPALSFDYIDVSGSTTLRKARIQINHGSPTFSSPTWDSGELDEFDSVVYLSGTTYPGTPEGEDAYWRIKVMDGDGLWSEWSSAATYRYVRPPVTELTSIDPDEPRWWDSTPDISWTLAGENQIAYRITVARTVNPSRILWDSGLVESSETSASIPPGVLRWDDVQYRLIVRLWGDTDRAWAANFLPYSVLKDDVLLDEDMSKTPVSNVEVAQVGRLPRTRITWERTATADVYEIVRQRLPDGEKTIIDRILHADAIQPDGTYAYEDRGAPPRTPVRYIVRAVTNGRRSGGIPTDSFSYAVEAVWLTTPTEELVFQGSDQGQWSMPPNSTEHEVLNSPAPTLVLGEERGYSVTFELTLVEEHLYQPGLTAQEKSARLLSWRDGVQGCRLVVGDLNIPVKLVNPTSWPTPDAIPPQYIAGFTAHQEAEMWWSDR